MDRVSYLPTEKRTRLSVSCDDALVDIADEDCTSDTCREALRDPASVTRVCMTREHAAWLRDALVALDLGPSPVTVAPVERTPEVVLRAMLLAHEAHAEALGVAYYVADKDDEAPVLALAERAEVADRACSVVRESLFMVRAGLDPVLVHGPLGADYEARLRGDRALDAPPMEVP